MENQLEKNLFPQLEGQNSEKSIENEKEPRLIVMLTRHTDRLPSGELTEEGLKKMGKKGEILGRNTSVLKGYSSNEKTDRTFLTSEEIARQSGIKSPLTDEHYSTRKVKGIQYDILKPEFSEEMKEAKKIINKATLREAGLSIEDDIEALPQEKQKEIAPLRAKNQELGFQYLFKRPGVAKRIASGTSNQLLHNMELGDRYMKYREGKDQKLQSDVVLNEITHGLFIEALLQEAGEIRNEDGDFEPIKTVEDERIGGFVAPGESIFLDVSKIKDNKIPVIFESNDRPKNNIVYIDINRIKELRDDYLEFEEKYHKK